jgi:DNA repair protein RecN (Recombination protein N)
MLTELRIRNFAVIESVTLPLAPGFNVLSGETGAGKSIVVGALGLLLGERGTADLVRTGADRAMVEGVFDCSDREDVLALLDEQGIEVEQGVVVLRREVTSGGKGRAWINGSTVTAGALAATGRRLADLHGQHESQTLLREDAQRETLDAFSGALDVAHGVRDAFRELSGLRAGIAALTARRDEATRRADYLRHVVREIADAKLVEGEEARVEEEVRRLSHVEDLRTHLTHLREALEAGDRSALGELATARRALAAAQRLDASLSAMQESLDSALVTLEEVARDALAYEASLDVDPERLATLEARRELLHRLTRKYGGSVATVLETLAASRAELDVVDTADVDLRALAAKVEVTGIELSTRAAELTAKRRRGAVGLARAVEAMLPDLGLPGGRFAVDLAARAEVGSTGAEEVEFRVALNVGHDARPLSRVASGGELSRVMLALKTTLARLDRVPTLVFDEVDVGIGGAVALRVGDTLRRLSAHHQVLVITHLAQIAARAHHHLVVAKGARGGITTADIAVVAADERVSEVARMLGGDPASEVSRAHARELLAAASGAAAGEPALAEPPVERRPARRKRSA